MTHSEEKGIQDMMENQEGFFTKEEVQRIGKSAALSLSDEQLTLYADSLNKVIQLIQQIDQVDVSSISLDDLPCDPKVMAVEELRQDVVQSDFSRDDLMINAPESVGGLIRVPSIIAGR